MNCLRLFFVLFCWQTVVASSVPAKHVQNLREKDHPPLLGILRILGILGILWFYRGGEVCRTQRVCAAAWQTRALTTVGYQFCARAKHTLCRRGIAETNSFYNSGNSYFNEKVMVMTRRMTLVTLEVL